MCLEKWTVMDIRGSACVYPSFRFKTDIGTSHFWNYFIFILFLQSTDWNSHAGTLEHMLYWGHQLNLMIQEQQVFLSINGRSAWPNTPLWLWYQDITLYLFFSISHETNWMTKYLIIFSLFDISLQYWY